MSPQELAKRQDKIVHDLKKEINDAKAEGVDTVIFSSEHLHSRLRTEAELERLHTILDGMGFDQITVLIYLREQASCASSLYGTKILFDGSINPSPNPKEDDYWDNICDHKKSLLRIRNIFSKESVLPRLFIKESLVEHCIITDFLHASCIDLPREIFQFPVRTNESISALGLEVLRAFNKRQPMYLEDGSLNKTRATVPQLFLASFKDGNKFPRNWLRNIAQSTRHQMSGCAKNIFLKEKLYFLQLHAIPHQISILSYTKLINLPTC